MSLERGLNRDRGLTEFSGSKTGGLMAGGLNPTVKYREGAKYRKYGNSFLK